MVKSFYLLGFIILFTFCSCNRPERSLFRIMEDGLYGFVDSTGSVVITPQYKYVSRFNQYGYAAVITDYSLRIEKGKFGLADTLLHIKYGFIDKQNNVVVDTVHAIDLSVAQMLELEIPKNYVVYANNFSKGELGFNDFIDAGFIQLRADKYVVQNPKTKLMGFMNIKGDTTITAKYNVCNPFYGGIASVSLVKESPTLESFVESLNSTILIDSVGNTLTNERYFRIPSFSGINNSWACRLINDESNNPHFIWLLLDKKGKVCSDTLTCTYVYNSRSNLYVWQQMIFDTPFYSFVNNKGTIMTDFDHDGTITFSEETYSDVTSFSDTIAGVKVKYGEEPCWTFINNKFEFISQPFDSVGIFSEGVVAVKEFSKNKANNKWGFVNKKFKEIIPYKYDEVGMFVDGLAYFKIKNIEGYINKRGEIVWSRMK